MSVNLSVKQFAHANLIAEISEIIRDTGAHAQCIKLEITESGLMENVETSMAILTQLKELDLTLSIDDFGTGYSSLSYLHRFPFDVLKVDRSFVGNMEAEEESRQIVINIVSLAHGLRKEVVAEGIETPGQITALREINSEYGQGYLFSAPVPTPRQPGCSKMTLAGNHSGSSSTETNTE